ncbi:hypothetical protein GOP47_0005419 [Adiantum capillus-veneris]|uniref:F-box domain-containing protein n=1 Tax=Adiantum capillus-veneris TaxID=13818 RepID=A0A9D4V5P6_ADICA|nr:hypothetical protein GOP47_0005419 [Adiantum capillus-veneris]
MGSSRDRSIGSSEQQVEVINHRKRGATSSSIWDNLPQELAEKVFSLLPVASIFRCRCVCKKWLQVLSGRTFLELWAQVSPQASWFLVYNNLHGIAAFSPSSSSWSNVPVFARCSLDPQRVLLIASSGGLLCFRTRNTKYATLIVCNPVTKRSRALPDMLRVRYIQVLGMATDKATNTYKILVTGASDLNTSISITEVYDSCTGQWHHHGSSQQDFLQFWCEVQAVWCNGSFYCLTMPTQGLRLLAHNMLQKKWLDVCVDMPSGDLRCASLLACQGRLLLAGKIVVDNSVKSVRIWELDQHAYVWKEVTSIPSAILLKIHLPYFLGIQCHGKSDLICFSRHRGWQSVMYDMSLKTWQWMPENKAYRGRKVLNGVLDRNNLIGMAYEPNLVASV